MKNQRFVLHAEVEGGENVEIYEGTSQEEALAFLDGLQKPTRLSVELDADTDNGERRSLHRHGKGEDVAGLEADARSWFAEFHPDYKNEPVKADDREKMTITAGDVQKITPKDLGL